MAYNSPEVMFAKIHPTSKDVAIRFATQLIHAHVEFAFKSDMTILVLREHLPAARVALSTIGYKEVINAEGPLNT